MQLQCCTQCDSSSIVGGDVGEISIADPMWPAPIRESLSTLANW